MTSPKLNKILSSHSDCRPVDVYKCRAIQIWFLFWVWEITLLEKGFHGLKKAVYFSYTRKKKWVYLFPSFGNLTVFMGLREYHIFIFFPKLELKLAPESNIWDGRQQFSIWKSHMLGLWSNQRVSIACSWVALWTRSLQPIKRYIKSGSSICQIQ